MSGDLPTVCLRDSRAPTTLTNVALRLQLYWATSAILNPTGFTVTSFAILQQHAQALNFTFQMLFFDFSRAAECFSHIKELYDVADVENKLVDGDEPYPNSVRSTDQGMDFELK